MKNLFRRIAGATMLVLAACAPLSVLQPTVVLTGPVERQISRVIQRHDTYVQADQALDEQTRQEWLADSQIVLLTVDQTPPEQGLLVDQMPLALGNVLDRHDLYLNRDSKLDPLALETYLAGSDSLRRLFYPQRQ